MKKSKNLPFVSVLMPMHNEEKHVGEAIESILNQTYENFEFLIIDDGSIDKSPEIVLSYKDPRIQYLKNKKNIGISNTLNRGLTLAKGKYIFRMDADDLSLPTRMEKQVQFMEAHPGIGLCGTNVLLFGTTNKEFKYYQHDKEIRTNLIAHPSISNGAMILRKSVLQKLDKWFDPQMDSAEDHDLWERMSHHTKFANLQEVLYHYRMHQGNGHLAIPKKLVETVMTIRIRIIQQHLKRNITSQEREIFEKALGSKKGTLNQEELLKFNHFLKNILRTSQSDGIYSKKVLKPIFLRWWKSQVINKSLVGNIKLLFVLPPLYFQWLLLEERGWLLLKKVLNK